VWPKIAIGAVTISILANSLREIENNRHWYDVIFPRQSDEGLARLDLNIGRINNGEFSRLEPLGGDKVQDLKSCVGRRLIVLIVRN
jgi:hypothetical protein